VPTLIPADRVEVFDVLVPANTAKAAPLETVTPFVPGLVVGIEVFIPDGHSGLTGLRLAVAHSPVIPRTEGAWIIGNDEKITWDVTGYPSTGAWSVFGYNTDAFAHSFHLRFLIAEIDRMTAALPATPAQTPELA
jgi:hypothetical protein